MSDIRRMQIGQLVDFCIEYNDRQKRMEAETEKAEKKGRKRRGNQNDINAFFG